MNELQVENPELAGKAERSRVVFLHRGALVGDDIAGLEISLWLPDGHGALQCAGNLC